MIRRIGRGDAAAVAGLAVASGLFPEAEASIVEKMLADYFGGNQEDGHACVIDEEEGVLLGVAYYEPALATDGTWYLTMIGVRSDFQGRGRGSALMRYVEDALGADGQRLLLVETSGGPDFGPARGFYAKLGYEEEARVRDYYEAGDDMVLYRKALKARV